MPHDRSKYPADWPAISRRIRFERAGNKCEKCGARNHEPHPVTGGMVTLTCAHWPDPDPMNCADENLHSWCNACHNGMDAPMRVQHARETRRRKKLEQGQMSLPEVPA